MILQTIPKQLTAIPTLALIIAAVGCSKEAVPTTSHPSASTQPTRVIVEGRAPSDTQQQAMLAAKEALFTKLSGRLMEAMSSQGPAAAISVCQKEASQIAAEVSAEHNLRIGRTGVRLRNPNNESPGWAKPLTDKKSDEPQFVVLDNDNAAALLPIKLQAQCLMCHGPKEQIAPVIQDQLATRYPDDAATGFSEGELRGWFWIEIPGG